MCNIILFQKFQKIIVCNGKGIEYQETFDVNPECIGKIIGKAGIKIKAFQLKHDVRTKFDNHKVTITGLKLSVESARREMEEMLEEMYVILYYRQRKV